jgi:hypothetical protein
MLTHPKFKSIKLKVYEIRGLHDSEKEDVLWVLAPSSLAGRYQRFEGKCRFIFVNPEDGGRYEDYNKHFSFIQSQALIVQIGPLASLFGIS